MRTTRKSQAQASRILVIVPTLRERTNIIAMTEALGTLPGAGAGAVDLLVIDDASDDGTPQALRELMARGHRLTVLNRPGRRGLGTAYTLGLAYARRGGYRHVVQMDADGSHEPAMIPDLIEAVSDADSPDMSIGSRYVRGGGAEGWSRRRWWLSRLANCLARTVVGGGVRDVTAGFRCTRVALLRTLPLERLLSRGFSWQWEFNRLVLAAGGRVTEVPIRFRERAAGRSKLTWTIAWEGLIRLFQLHLAARPPIRTRGERPAAPKPSPIH